MLILIKDNYNIALKIIPRKLSASDKLIDKLNNTSKASIFEIDPRLNNGGVSTELTC